MLLSTIYNIAVFVDSQGEKDYRPSIALVPGIKEVRTA
jgi:hypothetical protein